MQPGGAAAQAGAFRRLAGANGGHQPANGLCHRGRQLRSQHGGGAAVGARAGGVRGGSLRLSGERPAPDLPSELVTLLPGSEPPQPGQPVQLCRVEKVMMASAPSPAPWYFPASDAIVMGEPVAGKKAKVQVYAAGRRPSQSHPGGRVRSGDLGAGATCASSRRGTGSGASQQLPGAGAAGARLRPYRRNASARRGDGRVEYPANRPAVPEESGGRDFLRRLGGRHTDGERQSEGDPRNRGSGPQGCEHCQPGRGSGQPHPAGFPPGAAWRSTAEPGRRIPAPGFGHLPAAWQVRTGAADCCIATGAAARLFGLAFIPLVSERYDLAMRRRHLDLPAIQTLLNTLSRSSFRRELQSIGGYDTRTTGQRML